ncbi:ABC transporter ATP-binding protein [Aquimarina sp. AD10]|uniref:ATP-binding protein n=1 Tax=Aquimarina aggregata TaxID=1642818 RepID=A0A162WIZ3_9FLAO|nr:MULTISPECIES: ABC transporter ATP-binding protein [Aquimarina]AXT61574.1 ABC transporter ATP-binding protein [Aquimarina sp. AD10]KZS38131.1 ATP-binding protein [Aquimarina aggregata]RKM90058.1 ABC transporter ATP-binding protein [Aquimarina sp. AD10]
MILEGTHINKYFYDPDKHQVLKDNSLQISEGELVSIYGESGSGKSTLLYILSTLDTDFEGQLFIQGQDIKKLDSTALTDFRNKHIGFVYQFHYLLPEFNVLQNVMLPALKLREKSRVAIQQDALALLDEVGIAEYAHRPSYKLSGGQQQRVAIARALINDPTLIIADEPTGNLDQKNTDIVFKLLQNITENRGKTVLIATHNPKIYKNSTRTIEMIDGSIRL